MPSPISMGQSNESGDDSMSIDSSAGGGLTSESELSDNQECMTEDVDSVNQTVADNENGESVRMESDRNGGGAAACSRDSDGVASDGDSDGVVSGSRHRNRGHESSRIRLESLSGEWKKREPTSLLWTSPECTPGPNFSMRSRVCTAAVYFSLRLFGNY